MSVMATLGTAVALSTAVWLAVMIWETTMPRNYYPQENDDGEENGKEGRQEKAG